jgi:hypothetical protein
MELPSSIAAADDDNDDDDEGQINLSIFFHFPSILLYTDRFFLSKWACLWEYGKGWG